MRRKKRKISLLRLILIIVLFPIIVIWAVVRKVKLKNSQKTDAIDVLNISQIDCLSGVEFENLLKQIFENQGYLVELTKSSHDFGADLVLRRNNTTAVVQAKCYSKNIGIKAVQEIISARKHYGAEEMFVATNRYFSKEAVVLASEYEVRLIDRDVLIALVKKHLPKICLNEKKYVATLEEEKRKIQAKYKFWI